MGSVHASSGPPKLTFATDFLSHCNAPPPYQRPRHDETPSSTKPAILNTSIFVTTFIPSCHVSPSSVSTLSPQRVAHTNTCRSDLVMCRKQSGISIGRLCDKCDGKCPVCDSYVRPTTLARICDECSFGNYQNKCVVCGGEGISDAFYCFECTRLEKDRDGCPKIINLGSSRTDLFYQKKNFRNH